MRYLLITCSLFFFVTTAFAQVTAVTSNGDEVILNTDGTWKYVDSITENQHRPDTNKTAFVKTTAASFLVKSNKINCGVYIDPKKWSFSKNKEDEASEYEFVLRGKDAYCLILPEKSEIPLETYRLVAIENAKEVASDIKIIKEEYRKVNGLTVLLIQMGGTVKGIKITYLGYYFSSPEGSMQLLTYSASNLFDEQKADLELLLNGFVVLKN